MEIAKEMAAKDMTSSQVKMTNSQKILKYLQENIGEVSNEEISRETGIDKTNIPREIKKLEVQGYKITKRYEQVGRSKFVWFLLTSSQEKETSSQTKKKKLSPKKKDKIEEPKPKSITQLREAETVNLINGMSQEVKSFGRTIPLSQKQTIANDVFEHLKNLTKGIKYYLNAWEARYKRYLREKPGNPLIDEYEDMQDTLTFLNQLKLKKKELKNAKSRK